MIKFVVVQSALGLAGAALNRVGGAAAIGLLSKLGRTTAVSRIGSFLGAEPATLTNVIKASSPGIAAAVEDVGMGYASFTAPYLQFRRRLPEAIGIASRRGTTASVTAGVRRAFRGGVGRIGVGFAVESAATFAKTAGSWYGAERVLGISSHDDAAPPPLWNIPATLWDFSKFSARMFPVHMAFSIAGPALRVIQGAGMYAGYSAGPVASEFASNLHQAVLRPAVAVARAATDRARAFAAGYSAFRQEATTGAVQRQGNFLGGRLRSRSHVAIRRNAIEAAVAFQQKYRGTLAQGRAATARIQNRYSHDANLFSQISDHIRAHGEGSRHEISSVIAERGRDRRRTFVQQLLGMQRVKAHELLVDTDLGSRSFADIVLENINSALSSHGGSPLSAATQTAVRNMEMLTPGLYKSRAQEVIDASAYHPANIISRGLEYLRKIEVGYGRAKISPIDLIFPKESYLTTSSWKLLPEDSPIHLGSLKYLSPSRKGVIVDPETGAVVGRTDVAPAIEIVTQLTFKPSKLDVPAGGARPQIAYTDGRSIMLASKHPNSMDGRTIIQRITQKGTPVGVHSVLSSERLSNVLSAHSGDTRGYGVSALDDETSVLRRLFPGLNWNSPTVNRIKQGLDTLEIGMGQGGIARPTHWLRSVLTGSLFGGQIPLRPRDFVNPDSWNRMFSNPDNNQFTSVALGLTEHFLQMVTDRTSTLMTTNRFLRAVDTHSAGNQRFAQHFQDLGSVLENNQALIREFELSVQDFGSSARMFHDSIPYSRDMNAIRKLVGSDLRNISRLGEVGSATGGVKLTRRDQLQQFAIMKRIGKFVDGENGMDDWNAFLRQLRTNETFTELETTQMKTLGIYAKLEEIRKHEFLDRAAKRNTFRVTDFSWGELYPQAPDGSVAPILDFIKNFPREDLERLAPLFHKFAGRIPFSERMAPARVNYFAIAKHGGYYHDKDLATEFDRIYESRQQSIRDRLSRGELTTDQATTRESFLRNKYTRDRKEYSTKKTGFASINWAASDGPPTPANLVPRYLIDRFGGLGSEFGFGMSRARRGANPKLFTLPDFFNSYSGFMAKRAITVAGMITTAKLANSFMDLNPMFDSSGLDEGADVFIAEQLIKARMVAAKAMDIAGVTGAAKHLEGLMPGSTTFLPGATLGGIFSGVGGALWGGVMNRIVGAVGGEMLDPTYSYGELQELYSGRRRVPIRKGRFWMLGSDNFYGGQALTYVPHWFPRMKAKPEDAIYGSAFKRLIHEPFPLMGINPVGWAVDPYYVESYNYYDRPAMTTQVPFEELPFFGPVAASALGQRIKPIRHMHTDAFTDLGGGGSKSIPGAYGVTPANPNATAAPMITSMVGFRKDYSYTRPILPGINSPTRVGKELFYRNIVEAPGLYGFLTQTLVDNLGLSQNIQEHQNPTPSSAGKITSFQRAYWDKQLGDSFIINEYFRRFVPRPMTENVYDPIPNQLPEWMQAKGEEKSWYQEYFRGDPYSKVPMGLYRMPGPAYEKLYDLPEGNYTIVDRLRILGDTMPYSTAYKETYKEAQRMKGEGYLSAQQVDELAIIRKERQAKLFHFETFPYRFKGKVLNPEDSYSGENFNDLILPGSNYSIPERVIGSLWENITSLPNPMLTKFLQQRSPVEQYYRRVLYGKDVRMWSDPIEDFFTPYYESVRNTTGAVEGFARGFSAGMVFGGPFEALAGGVGLGAYGGIRSILGASRGIPGGVKEARELEDYFQKIKHIKGEMLYELTGEEEYLTMSKETMYGTEKYGFNFETAIRSVPYNERPFVSSFSAERDPEVRRHILGLVSEPFKRFLTTVWAEDTDEVGEAIAATEEAQVRSMYEYFRGGANLPGVNWAGWDPNVDLDLIKLQTYRQEGLDSFDAGLGWSCITPNTNLIDMYGVKTKARDVVVGSFLLSKEGANAVVLETHSRYADDEDLVTIHVTGNSKESIVATSNHDILVTSKDNVLPHFVPIGEVRCLHHNLVLPRPHFEERELMLSDVVDIANHCVPLLRSYTKPVISHGKHGGHVAVNPQPIKEKTIPDVNLRLPALYRFFGYYLAVGRNIKRRDRRRSSYGVSFAFHIDEQEYVEDVCSGFEEIFGITAHVCPREKRNLVEIQVCSTMIGELFHELLGEYSHAKEINPLVFHAPRACLRELIIGYMRAHGRNKSMQWTATSASEKLIDQLYLMLLSLGINPNIRKISKSQETLTTWGSRRPVWAISIYGKEYDNLIDGVFNDGPIVREVVRVDSEKYSGIVHDFTMTGEPSYSCIGGIYHNSQIMQLQQSPYIPGPVDPWERSRDLSALQMSGVDGVSLIYKAMQATGVRGKVVRLPDSDPNSAVIEINVRG